MNNRKLIKTLKRERRKLYPYGMPMNHYYADDGKIYFHCGRNGHRLDALKKCDKASFCVCDSGEKTLGVHDASEIVYDEWIGMWITMWHVPLILTPVAFVLFRLFDISKIGPVGKIQDLPGGLGIMADDVLAGIIGRLVLAVVIFFLF